MKRLRLITIISIVILLLLAAVAGDLEPIEPPMAGSRMPTLQELYDYLATGAMWTDSESFQEPTAGPAPTMKTLKEIYDDIKALFELCQAGPDQVLDTVTFFNTDPANWGPRTGTIPIQTVNPATVNQPPGYYESFDLSSVDPDLVAENIRSGVTIFGLGGSVLEASGDANDGDVLTGKTYSNDSGNSTGTMPNVGQQNILSGITDVAIQLGYHDGTGTVAGDDDLVAGNIQNGVEIFGVTGTALLASGTANATQVLEGTTFSNSSEVNIPGTMPDRGSVIITPDTTPQVIEEGYHNGLGYVEGDTDLVPGNIKSGATIFGMGGDSNVVNTGDGTATANDILLNKTAYVGGQEVTGAVMPGDNVIGLEGELQIVIPDGMYTGGKTAIAQDSGNLISSNIRAGAIIFGVVGDQNVVNTSDGTATENDILLNKTAYVGGQEVTGTITEGTNVTGLDGEVSILIPDGLYTGGKTATAQDSQLISTNIAKDVEIFGITGTLVGASGNATPADVLAPKTFSTDSGIFTGEMLDQTATLNEDTSSYEAGYYDTFDLTALDSQLAPENIAAGEEIFGITGTFTGGEPAYPALVPKTGQTKCYDVSGDEISCSGTGQDGDLQKGVAWPDPRFTDNNDGTVTDNLTGLIWLKDSNCQYTLTWDEALTFTNSLYDGWTDDYGFGCGLSDGSSAGDWRLPNIRELLSLLDFSRSEVFMLSPDHPFDNVQVWESPYWSSTTVPGFGPEEGWVWVWEKDDITCLVTMEPKNNHGLAWPVRGGQ